MSKVVVAAGIVATAVALRVLGRWADREIERQRDAEPGPIWTDAARWEK